MSTSSDPLILVFCYIYVLIFKQHIMKNVFNQFKEKEVTNVWAITGGGAETDGEDSKEDDRGDARD